VTDMDVEVDIVHSDLHSQSSLSPGSDRGGPDGTVRDGRPLSRPLSGFEVAKSSAFGADYTQWRTDHLGLEFDQFGTDRGNTTEEAFSSPTVNLAGQKLQRQSSEDAAPVASSVVQVVAKPTASSQDSADRDYEFEQSRSDCQSPGLGNTASKDSKDNRSTLNLS